MDVRQRHRTESLSFRITGNTRTRRAHLVGIAGAGMRALAEVLLGRGWQLSGSDLVLGPARSFAEAGVRLFEGHAAAQLPPGTDLVVYSDAVGAENPELRRAEQLGIPTCSYFEMAGRLMSGRLLCGGLPSSRHGLAVAGTHGKSTTTAMAAQILTEAGADPTVLCGAAALGKSSGGRAGRGELVLVEACEYRENFLHLRPQQAVILGIEPDHFDYYRSGQQLEEAFARFARLVPRGGLILARYDCPATRRITAGLPCRVVTFGIDRRAGWSARSLTPRRGRYGFEIWRNGRQVCQVDLRVPGRHNVLNALAAAALAGENGVPSDRIARALGRFRGVRRRFERFWMDTWRGVSLVDDYAHHPTEVAVTLATVRQVFPGRCVWCVFQPHQVSRTARLLDELAASLQNADRVLVAEVFRAREAPPQPGEVAAADLARRLRHGGVDAPPAHTSEEIVRLLQTGLVPGDVLVTMGAGDIGEVLREGLIQGGAETWVAG